MVYVALLIVLLLLCAVIVYMLLPGRKREIFLLKGPRYYTHRGLYSADQTVPENSLAAFSLAADRGYGIELDVQLTRDGKIVVFHDDDLFRCTGVSGRIGEYLLDDLQKDARLFSSGYRIPLFTDVLGLICGKVPLIIEIKACPEWNKLCSAVLSVLREYNGLYCVESFDPRIVGWFRFHAPDIVRGQISEQYRYVFKKYGPVVRFGLSSLLVNFISRPDFIAYRLGKRSFLADLALRKVSCRVGWPLDPSVDPVQAAGFDVLIFEHMNPDESART